MPNLRGVFASNLIMAQGAGQAIAENKAQDKIKLIGFDNDEKLVKFLEDGVISALIVQDPFRMGYDGIKTALAASKGEKVAGRCRHGRQPHHQGQHDLAALPGAPEPEGEVMAAGPLVLSGGPCP